MKHPSWVRLMAILFLLLGAGCMNKTERSPVAEQTESDQKIREDQEVESLILDADKLRESGDKDGAKPLYEMAAMKGSADAYYALTYYYVLEPEDRVSHLIEAASQGHQEALDHLFETLFLRGYDSEITDRINLLLIVTEDALTRFPYLEVNEDYYTALKWAAEAGRLDLAEFAEKYTITLENDPYYIWELAEEASKAGGRFGGPDMRLTLQLIALGGSVPAEMVSAIDEVYSVWKSGKTQIFLIDEHITSGIGMKWATQRWEMENESKKELAFETFLASAPENARELLIKERQAFQIFLEKKVWNEEGHDGSGWYTWGVESSEKQEAEHFETVKQFLENNITLGKQPENETELQKIYDQVMVIASKPDYHGAGIFTFYWTVEGIRDTERAWIVYHNAFIDLLAVIRPDIAREDVKKWLTAQRIENLNGVLDNITS